jgi:hypothetical protein
LRTTYWIAGVLLAACGDGGTEPSVSDLVPIVLAVTPQPPPSPTEHAVLVTLEVRTASGQPYPEAIVQWEATSGEVLSPALTDEQGQLQALWSFNLTLTPSGSAAELRACARREPNHQCAYTDPVSLTIP